MYSKLKLEIIECIEEALVKMKIKLDDELVLEQPPSPDMGDISSNVAFLLARKLKKSPVEIAAEIRDKIQLPL